jgi:hypothetical protein
MKAGLPIGNNRPAISLPKTPAPAATAQRTVTDTGLRDLQAQIEKTASFYDKYEAAIRGVSDQQLAFIHTADEATKQLHAGNITWDAYQRIIDRARDSLDGIDKQVKKTSDTMSEFAVQAAHNMQDAFADFLFDPFKDGLKGMLGSFIDTLRRMAANAIAARLFDKLLGGKDGTTGGTGGGLLSSFLGAIFGGGRAYGGAVAAGGLYEINEQSAPGETLNVAGRQYLMMGPQGGTVEPLQRSRGMGSTTINVAVQPTSTRRTADQVADAIARKQRLAMARNG